MTFLTVLKKKKSKWGGGAKGRERGGSNNVYTYE
jgi:hypothetical protein